MRVPLQFPPGLRRDGTEGQSRGRWMESSLVRAYGDDVGPILGWRPRSASAVSGKARAILTWNSAPAERRIAIGTHTNLYIQNASGALFDITPAAFVAGDADATVNYGYGGGAYGEGTFGTPRIDTGTPMPATVWDLDTWDVSLLACCASDGRILQWDNNTAVDAAAVTNAPTACSGVFSTPEAFTVAAGASDNPRLIAWSDRGDNTTWTPSSTNLAGDFELRTFGEYRLALKVPGVTLILTSVDAHAMRYVGLPSVYVFDRLGDNCGAISKRAGITRGDQAAWWATGGFWTYNGGLSKLECPITDIQSEINAGQSSKITGYHNAAHSEYVWHYPSTNSTENDKYISHNYLTGQWWQGDLARLSGAADGVFTYPLLMGADGLVYEHEVPGLTWDGAVPYVRSGPVKLGSGEFSMRVTGAEFDFAGTPSVRFFNRDRPTSTESETAETTLAPGFTDLRFSARQTEIEVLFSAPTDRFGRGELVAVPGGRR